MRSMILIMPRSAIAGLPRAVTTVLARDSVWCWRNLILLSTAEALSALDVASSFAVRRTARTGSSASRESPRSCQQHNWQRAGQLNQSRRDSLEPCSCPTRRNDPNRFATTFVPQNAHVTLLARFAAAPRSRPPGVSLSRPPPPKQTRGALIAFCAAAGVSHETHEH